MQATGHTSARMISQDYDRLKRRVASALEKAANSEIGISKGKGASPCELTPLILGGVDDRKNYTLKKAQSHPRKSNEN